MPPQFTLEELWVIQERVRQDKDYGAPWDKAEMSLVHKAILALDAQAIETHELECSDGLLWAIENQVSQGLIVGTIPIGRNILRKVFQALHIQEGDRDVPTSFKAAFDNGGSSSNETDNDASAAKEISSLGNLSESDEGAS